MRQSLLPSRAASPCIEEMGLGRKPKSLSPSSPALLCPNDSADVFVESFAKVWDDGRVTVFCGTDHVVCQLCETAHQASPAVAASRLGVLVDTASAG